MFPHHCPLAFRIVGTPAGEDPVDLPLEGGGCKTIKPGNERSQSLGSLKPVIFLRSQGRGAITASPEELKLSQRAPVILGPG